MKNALMGLLIDWTQLRKNSSEQEERSMEPSNTKKQREDWKKNKNTICKVCGTTEKGVHEASLSIGVTYTKLGKLKLGTSSSNHRKSKIKTSWKKIEDKNSFPIEKQIITSKFSADTMQMRREWSEIFKRLRETQKLTVPYPEKYILRQTKIELIRCQETCLARNVRSFLERRKYRSETHIYMKKGRTSKKE